MNTTAKSVLLAAAALTAGITLSACAGSSQDPAASTPSADTVTTSVMPVTDVAHNQFDVMFSQHMIPHHQQAIEMSDMVLGKQGVDPRVVDLAERIKAAQTPEIEQMRGWLAKWGVPEMTGMGMAGGGMPGHQMGPDNSMMPGMGGAPMAGMMSAAEMTELQNAQGPAATKLFLDHMIRHHEGAITMARNEIDRGVDQDTIALSERIIVDQQREIDEMKQILASL
ncbi:MAG: DUF305 domain-containing protein [Actinomycetota bacterium]|nr:DUF305 domain-containing protein [Actinomycetota bacterium]